MTDSRSEKTSYRINWSGRAERGSWWTLRLVMTAIRRFGAGPLRPIVPFVAIYFVLFLGEARRASRDYLVRVGRIKTEGWRFDSLEIYRHIRMFAFVILDRLELWSGAIDRFDIQLHGESCMQDLIDRKRGAMLVGAHMGSFDILRLIARKYDIRVNVIMYTGNAQLINRAFSELDPASGLRLIELDTDQFSTALEIRRCIQKGEFVAMLGDRVPPVLSDRRKISAEFLGKEALFPQGPFLIAAILDIPLIMTVALRRSFRVYDAYFEELSEREVAPVRDRSSLAGLLADRYVRRLEDHCRRAPLQWFNFYDFWSEG